MIVHLVFFRMSREADDHAADENARELVRRLEALSSKIPEIVELRAGLDVSQTPASFDVGLLTKFRSRVDLEAYRVHPEHQKVVEFLKGVTTERAVVDFLQED